ncbi:MAG: hypothetical protein RLZZ584_2362 [Pseudomonadota bacterium]|jgi:nitrogen fixation negative regulator NifL
MPLFDLRTLSFLALFSTVLMAVGIRLAGRWSVVPTPELRAWNLGAALWALGLMTVALRGSLVELVAIVAGNTLIIGGLTWIHFGLRLAAGLPRGPRWDLLLAGTLALGSSYFALVDPRPAARVVMFSTAIALVGLASAQLLLGLVARRSGDERVMLRCVGIAFLGFGLLFCLRAAVGVATLLGHDLTALALTLQKLAFVVAIVLNLALMFGLTHWVVWRNVSERKQAQQQVHQLAQAVEHSSQAIVLVDLQGCIVYVNSAFVQVTGYGRDELIGRNPRILQSGHTPPETYAAMWAALTHGRTWQGELVNRRKDGSEFIEQASMAPIVDADGTIVQYVAVKEDITERRVAADRLSASESRLRAVFEGARDGIVIVDAQTRAFVDANPMACSMLGYSRDELLALGLADIHPRDDLPRVVDEFRRQLRGEITQTEPLPTLRKGGSVFYADVSVAELMLGGQRYMTGFLRDITERRQAAAELDRYRDHLETLVDARTRDLALATAQAEAASVAKSAFLANMSHEIRTPLNAIAGMTWLMKREGLPVRQAERLGKIDAAGQHLLEIINAVLDLSKIEANRLTLEDTPVQLPAIVANVTAMLTDRAHAKGVTLVGEVQACAHALRGDATRLQQALLNYAANALKFTDAGTVTIRVRLLDDAAEHALVRFEVQDSGIGIAPDMLDRLFTPFEQVDSSATRRHGGTGLGLAINRQLARLMGGEVGVRSTPGTGSTFWFTARLAKAARVPAPQPGGPPRTAEDRLREELPGRRILLVDDEPTNREVMLELLASAAQEVDIAADGAQAVALAGSRAYDLILMDMQMPVMDGLEATRRLLALSAPPAAPIIALTANAFADDKARCLAAGMSDFIAKPYAIDAMFETVYRWLAASAGAGAQTSGRSGRAT